MTEKTRLQYGFCSTSIWAIKIFEALPVYPELPITKRKLAELLNMDIKYIQSQIITGMPRDAPVFEDEKMHTIGRLR